MTYRCDKCASVNAFQPLMRSDGDYEIGYLRCAECGAEVIAFVTDGELRKKIGRYRDMAAKIAAGKRTADFIHKTMKLKSANAKCGHKLRDEYVASHT